MVIEDVKVAGVQIAVIFGDVPKGIAGFNAVGFDVDNVLPLIEITEIDSAEERIAATANAFLNLLLNVFAPFVNNVYITVVPSGILGSKKNGGGV